MKTVKLICAAIVSVALFTTTVSAQNVEKPLEERIKLSTEQLDQKLDLSDEQVAEVYKVSLRYAQEMQELKNSTASRIEKYQAYQQSIKAQESKMKTILSKGQFKEWKKITDENKQKMKEKRK